MKPSMPASQLLYRLPSSVDVIPLPDGPLLLRSDSGSIRIEGDFAMVLRDRVIPLLKETIAFSDLCARWPDLPANALRKNLDELTAAGFVERSEGLFEEMPPFIRFLEGAGLSTARSTALLGQIRVAIFGLEGFGAMLADQFAVCQIGHISLCDPFTADISDSSLVPWLKAENPEQRREESAQNWLQTRYPMTRFTTSNLTSLDRAAVSALAQGHDLLVACWDQGFLAANHWVNRAAFEHNIPAAFASIRGHLATVGPMVVPETTPCYMCYRMRSIANEAHYEEAIAVERYFDRLKIPNMGHRTVFPPVLSFVASTLAAECIRMLSLAHQPKLAGNILEFDALDFGMNLHQLLQQPNCPVCAEKKNLPSSPLYRTWKPFSTSADAERT
jgi:bacteriocin biosynthesis cyclodehydratase domain-containing protein